MHKNPSTLWITLILFAIFCGLLSIKISAPWQFLHDDNGAWFSATARTHLIRGLAETKGQDFFLERGTNKLVPYLHHPPFISLYLATAFKISGVDTPLVARTSIAFMHIIAFLVFLRIASMIIGNGTLPILWAAFVFATVPMSVFFGKMPNHEVPGLLFLELGVLFSLCLVQHVTPSFRWLAPMFFAWLIVPLVSWHATLCGLAFILTFSATMVAETRRLFLLVSCTALLGALAFAVIQLLWANNWHLFPSQQTSLQHWLVVPAGENRIAFLIQSFTKIAKHGRKFYADIPWALSVGWTVLAGIKLIKRQPLSRPDVTVLSLGIGSIIYCVVFSHAVRIHAYQQFYMLPFIAISSALVISHLYDRLLRYRKSTAIALVMILTVITAISSAYRLSRLYGKNGSYAVQASQAIEKQFY